ncbi:MAG: LexA family protein [Candidatus Margulisiibacteriota bacterium]
MNATLLNVTPSTFIAPLMDQQVPAGFPSHADDFSQTSLDLSAWIAPNSAATFFVRASGESMKDAGIQDGDILVVDRSLAATDKRIVIAALNGELLVKRLSISNGHWELRSENPAFPPVVISPNDEMVIWGIVTFVIHKPV